MAIIAFQILVALLQDTLHFCPAYITHRLKIAGKALSTSTLPYQLVVLGACTALLLTSLVIWTVFAVKREITNGTQSLIPTVPIADEIFISDRVHRILLVGGSFGFRWNTIHTPGVEKGIVDLLPKT